MRPRTCLKQSMLESQTIEADWQMELKEKYKYRLILDETQSFAMVGQHGKGVTEYFGVPVS